MEDRSIIFIGQTLVVRYMRYRNSYPAQQYGDAATGSNKMRVSFGPTKSFTFNTLQQHLKDEAEERAFAQEACVISVTEAVSATLREKGLTQSWIAERIGRTKGFVSQVLSGSRNMTLRTLADLLWAAGVEVRGLELVPIGESTVSSDFMDAWLEGEGVVVATERVETGDRPLDLKLSENAALTVA